MELLHSQVWIGGFTILLLSASVFAEDTITITDLEAHLRAEALSQRRSYLHPENIATTRSYIAERWGRYVDYSLPVPVEYGTGSAEEILADNAQKVVFLSQDIVLDRSGKTYFGANYVLVLKGREWGSSGDRPILLGAHYDSVSGSPGTDDNASGMAAMLEISKMAALKVKDKQSNFTAIFVAFDFHETGLQGSRGFIQDLLVPGILNKYDIDVTNFQGALIIDSILNYDETPNSQTQSNENFAAIFEEAHAKIEANEQRGTFLVGVAREDDVALLSLVEATWEGSTGPELSFMSPMTLPVSGNSWDELTIFSDFLRSDHSNFWLADEGDFGLRAVFLSDTANFRGNMLECYHSECDNLDSITPDKLRFLAQTANTLEQVIAKAMASSTTVNSGGVGFKMLNVASMYACAIVIMFMIFY